MRSMAAAVAAATDAASGLPLVNYVLQHTLRSLCGAPQQPFWVYSIFWRILPRNYPPPTWENDDEPFDRSKGNKRNWILVWEDGYCDFAACDEDFKLRRKTDDSFAQPLQPDLFFKLSHDVYNYGEGLMGKIAADRSHKWIFRDPSPEQENVSLLCSWQVSADSYPRTWEAQFKAGIQTIAIIAVGEGLLQLGSTKKVSQDADYVLMLQRKFNYLQSIPGVFAQTKMTRTANTNHGLSPPSLHTEGPNPSFHFRALSGCKRVAQQDTKEDEACSAIPLFAPRLAASRNQLGNAPSLTTDVPSMYNSLQALLSKLPAVRPLMGTGAARMETSANAAAAAKAQSQTLLPKSNYWSDSHETTVPSSLPFSPPAANSVLLNSTDDIESYHCLFGQPIS